MARVLTSNTRMWPPAWLRFDPFRATFRLLTSVRFALLLIGAVIVGALLGVLVPQAPDGVRSNPAAFDTFTQFQHGRYGPLAEPMRLLGLFMVFHSAWFNGLVLVLLVSVAVCTANRIAPTARNVRRPIRRVNDRYFEKAHHRAAFATPAEPARLIHELRRRRFRVEEVKRPGDSATYLFADRFAWAQYGTFLSHLSLILFMSGAVVTRLVGFSTLLSIPEQATAPVFPTIHAGQMQVKNLGAEATRDEAGNVTRYHTDLAVYRDGKPLCSGTSTVNNPLHCAGYVLHQTSFAEDGAALQVRDLATNQIVYSEVQNLTNQGRAPSPRLVIQNAAGKVLFDDNVVLAPFNKAQLYAALPVPRGDGTDGTLLFVLQAVPVRGNQWALRIFHPDGATPADAGFERDLSVGERISAGGYGISVPTMSAIPLGVIQGVPGMERAAMLQLGSSLNGVRYLDVLSMGAGAAASDGTDTQADAGANLGPDGKPTTVPRLILLPGRPQTLNGYEYTFLGTRATSGITVRRDPGSTFIWVATALMMLGLAVTFYLPRRRLWVRITPERVQMAGVADRMVNFAAEMRRIGAAAGSPDATPAASD